MVDEWQGHLVSADALEVGLEVDKPMPDVTVRFSEVLEIGLKNWDWDPRLGSNGLLNCHKRWSWLLTFILPDGKDSSVSSETGV